MTEPLHLARRFRGSVDEAFAAIAAGTSTLGGHVFSVTAPTVASITRKVPPRWTVVLAVVGIALCLLNLSFVQTFVAIIWAGLALPAVFIRQEQSAAIIAAADSGTTRLTVTGLTSEEALRMLNRVTEEVGGD